MIDNSLIAKKIKKGLDDEQNAVMFKILKLSAGLLDAFSAQKSLAADLTVDELLEELEEGAESVEWNETPEDEEKE